MSGDQDQRDDIARAIVHRFGSEPAVPDLDIGADAVARLLTRRVHRAYDDRPVGRDLLHVLYAAALSAPSKSDLQQADILVVEDRAIQEAIADLIPGMPWIRTSPAFLVFLANHRRQQRLAEARGKPFPNHHLDGFFNATVDAAIVLATFVHAAEAVGLGVCPISVIRDHSPRISELLGLPDLVVPVSGLTIGWPATEAHISLRLPLEVTVHTDRFDDRDLDAHIDTYDRRRAAMQPFRKQREPERFGEVPDYGWSEDKARQYARPQRTDFGAFVRAKGFSLD